MEAAQKMLANFPPELCVITLTTSGSEANDLDRQKAQIDTKKKGIICLEGGYHGITKACM